MKKLALIVLGFVLLSASAFAAAPDRVGKWDAGVNLSGALNGAGSTDDALFVGGNLDYGYNQWWAFGVSGGWQQANSLNGGDLDAFDILADIILRVPVENQDFVPYVIGGLGYGYAHLDRNDGADPNDSGFAWKIGGGLDWFLNEHWALNFEVAYVDTGAKITGIGNVDYVNIGGGLKYLF